MAEPMPNIPGYARIGLAVLLGAISAPPLVTTVLVGTFADTPAPWMLALGLLSMVILWVLCWALAAATPTAGPRTDSPAGRRRWALVVAVVAAAVGAVVWVVLELVDAVSGFHSIPLGLVGALSLGGTVAVDWLVSRGGAQRA